MADSELWEHRYVETNGIRLHCVTQGEGELVVMLHGFPEFWYSWRHQIPALAERFKVVAPDMRGYNLSDKPEGIGSYVVPELTADVKGLIEAFGGKRAHIVAHDWGGVVAWSFAMQYPEYVDRLVVMNCPHPATFLKSLARNPRQMLRSWYMFFFQIPRLPELAIRSFDYLALERLFTGWAVNKEAFSAQDIIELKRAAAQPGALTCSINYYRALFRSRSIAATSGRFPKVKSPTLLIWAEEDRALGRELTYGLERYFDAGLEIRYIPNCSHWVQQEQPVLVNELIDRFLPGNPEDE